MTINSEQINTKLLKAIEHQEMGELELAKQLYHEILKHWKHHPDALHNLGILLYQTGDLAAAAKQLKNVHELYPKIEKFTLSYAKVLMRLKKLREAREELLKTLRQDTSGSDRVSQLLSEIENKWNENNPPSDKIEKLAELQKHEKSNDLINLSKNILKLYPRSFQVYNYLGVAYHQKKNLRLAVESFSKALECSPDYEHAAKNLSILLWQHGNQEKAIKLMALAVDISKYPTENMLQYSYMLQNMGNRGLAIQVLVRLLDINHENANALENLGNILTGVRIVKEIPNLDKYIEKLLIQGDLVRPKDLAGAVTSLLKLSNEFHQYRKLFQTSEYSILKRDALLDLSNNKIFTNFISYCTVPDLEIENLLKNLRTFFLLNIHEISNRKEILKLQTSLAKQCFMNEYLYDVSNQECSKLQELEASLESKQDKSIIEEKYIACLASYKPLTQFDWIKSFEFNDNLRSLKKMQIDEPNLEQTLKAEIKSLGKIKDNISKKVGIQYENHPYPRWFHIKKPREEKKIATLLLESGIKFKQEQIPSSSQLNILIAGCGTGAHPISTALRLPNSKVTAIDLSLSSLAFAHRKAREHGISNLSLYQADILDEKNFTEKFNLIESVGVIHHLSNPKKGWKNLTALLENGGLIKIGLYSSIARSHIKKMRNDFRILSQPFSLKFMKNIRNKIVESTLDEHKLLHDSPDFYSSSSLRDLLFHEQEHQFNLIEIKSLLKELKLEFCGFEFNPSQINKLGSDYSLRESTNLEKWHKFEEKNTRFFAGMYQFWCHKVI